MSWWHFFVSHADEIWEQTYQHLSLTITSMLIATVLGIAIGILLTKYVKAAPLVLGIVGVVQTIPSLALLGFLLPLVGIGFTPAIIALFLYALLPIVRNTYTGIVEIDPAIREATTGMGMNRWQQLRYVELPLAFPVILAGIRTSTVINVGIATLCALIAAGGLGEFIFRGISLNNMQMVLAGAIPASLLAIALDSLLGVLQRHARSKVAWLGFGATLLFTLLLFSIGNITEEKGKIVGGFNAEFIEREDGYIGLDSVYNLPLEIKELEIGLMYKALVEGDIDLIAGFSTDGRIEEYDLKLLQDDKNYFPPYYAIPMVHSDALATYPAIEDALAEITNSMNDATMASLNYQIDGERKDISQVANDFLKTVGIYANVDAGKSSDPDIVIGSKAFTENYLLAHIFAQVIENKTGLKTRLQLGFGGTKLVFDALRLGEIDLYPEYTGTAFLVLLGKKPEDISDFTDPDILYEDISESLMAQHRIKVLEPLGFNNTFALMMRRQHADSLSVRSISDLSRHLSEE